MHRVVAHVTAIHREELGASAVEYGMLVALIAAVVIGTVTLLGPLVTDLYEAVQWW